MVSQTSWDKLVFICYRNGALVRPDLQKVRCLLRDSNLGYVVPTGWYRFCLGDLTDAFFLRDRNVRKAVLQFIFALHAARGTPVTAETLWDEAHHAIPIGDNALTARAKRWGDALFNGAKRTHFQLLPFEPIHIPDGIRTTKLGYQMKQGISWLMVVDAEDKKAADGFDWTVFHEPPQ